MTLSVLETSLPMQRSHDTLALGTHVRGELFQLFLMEMIQELMVKGAHNVSILHCLHFCSQQQFSG